MDETYVKVNGRWAVSVLQPSTARGRTVDFYLSSRLNSKAAYRFLKILNNVEVGDPAIHQHG